jgi:hypothetical protein
MKNTTTDLMENQSHEAGMALAGSILVTSLVMLAVIRWAASGASYGSLLASLGIAAFSSLMLCLALWALPGGNEPVRRPAAAAHSRAT